MLVHVNKMLDAAETRRGSSCAVHPAAVSSRTELTLLTISTYFLFFWHSVTLAVRARSKVVVDEGAHVYGGWCKCVGTVEAFIFWSGVKGSGRRCPNSLLKPGKPPAKVKSFARSRRESR